MIAQYTVIIFSLLPLSLPFFLQRKIVNFVFLQFTRLIVKTLFVFLLFFLPTFVDIYFPLTLFKISPTSPTREKASFMQIKNMKNQ